MKAFFNKILQIDLSEKKFYYENLEDSILAETLGGKGLATHLLLKENPVGVEPFSPENRFIIATGPATGTKIWSQSRFGVYSKSPATGGYGESYCGGRLAGKIKSCGIDAIIIKGKFQDLGWIEITDYNVVFHGAKQIAGVETYEAENYLLEHSKPEAGAMVIGPAGENLIKFACIKSDKWRSLGRGGLGAVLGSKNVKGISFIGEQKAEIADNDLLKKINKDILLKAKDNPSTKNYQKYGTPAGVKLLNSVNGFPTRYWQSGHFDKWEQISADYMQENFDVKTTGCPTCFLKCTKESEIKLGRHKGLLIEGPEYETIYAFGGLNEVDSLEEIAWLNDVCDRLGLDTMSAGNISGFAIEARKRGAIDFDIDYNQPDKMAELFELIAYRKKVGEVFAKGIKEAAKELNLEDIAVHVKGLEPAGYDPRTLKGMGLSYATSARGACHLRGTFYKAELSGIIDRKQVEGKAILQIDYEDRATLFDCLILCRFFRDFILWDELALLIEATTGLKYNKEKLELIANNITQQSRDFNKQEGLDYESDTLPKRILKEATLQGDAINQDELEFMIEDYNRIRQSRNNA